MNEHKVKVLFVIAHNRIKKNNKAPIFCRITYRKKRKQFSTGVFVKPENWKNDSQFIKDTETDSNILNTKLSLISQEINKAFLILQVLPDSFDVDDIYKKYKGEPTKEEMTILGAYDLHNEKTKKLIGVDFNMLSWSRYVDSRKQISSFIRHNYDTRDIKLKDLNLKFILDLEYYYKTVLKFKQATIYRSMQRVKKIIQFAIAENYMKTDPFVLYKNKKARKKIVYLTMEELSLLEKHTFSQPRLEQIKDLFIFCCYTGLAYTEMSSLDKSHIVLEFDGNSWIKMNRQKTNGLISVPLLPKAINILDKYKSNSEKCLPSISNQKFNSYIKEIAEIVGIDKNLTHHTARKTFATTVLLYNDVPMEVVSELLGHSKLSITQDHYAKVVQKKVSEHMKKLNDRLA